jgi:uncharacterized protein YuzE
MTEIDFDNDVLVEIWFTGAIKLWRDAEILESDAEGDIEQAVQNAIGHTGACVESADEL